MNGDSSTAPVCPPPEPVMPGRRAAGPGRSPQQALASPSDSSNVTINRPSARKAGELRMRGTQRRRNLSARFIPSGSLASHESCASLHWLGTMKEKLGVRLREARSVGNLPSEVSLAAHCPESVSERKNTKGLCLRRYRRSVEDLLDDEQLRAIPSMYPRQVSPRAVSWSGSVRNLRG